VARSNIVFGESGDSIHVLEVAGEPERVVDNLKSRWAQLNRAEEGLEPRWVWVNGDRVLYVEEAGGPL
jgi:hypothetical protein